MGVFSFLRKSKQESVPNDVEFQSRAAEASNAVRTRRKRKQDSAAEEPVDPVLPEKKRARRRLIGAIALVLAAVIGLPMILDSEPKPLAEDIAIKIPSKDKPVPSAKGRSAAPPASTDKTSAAAGLDKNEEIISVPPVATTSVPAMPEARSKVGVAPQPSANSNVKPESRPEHKPEAKANAQPDDASRGRSIVEARPEVKAEKTKAAFEKKPAKFAIQVAALASQDKANELQGRLRSAGIKSQTLKVATQSGERVRVRVGPFASRDEAEKMRAKLARMGLSGTLVPA